MPSHHQYLYPLDAVRFASALSVCFFHLAFYDWAAPSSMALVFRHAAVFKALVPYTWWGWVGVQCFFVISGFVIASSANGASPAGFVRSRLLRLFPAVWICATLTLGAIMASGIALNAELALRYLRSLILWPTGDWIDGVYWSLAIEIAFYALIFVLLAADQFRRLSLLAWILALASAVYLPMTLLHDHQIAALSGTYQWFAVMSGFLPIRHGAFFALGIWLWMNSKRLLPASGWAGLWLTTGLCIFEIVIRAQETEGVEATTSAGQPVLVPVFAWMAMIIVVAASARWPDRLTPRSSRTRKILKLLGRTTYPLYLLHAVAGAAFMHALISFGVAADVALPTTIGGMLGAAVLVALVAEPALRKLTRSALDSAGARLIAGGRDTFMRRSAAAFEIADHRRQSDQT